MDEEKQGDVTVDLYAALDMETEAVAERSSELENSQPLGLLMGFLEVDDWLVWFRSSMFITEPLHLPVCVFWSSVHLYFAPSDFMYVIVRLSFLLVLYFDYTSFWVSPFLLESKYQFFCLVR